MEGNLKCDNCVKNPINVDQGQGIPAITQLITIDDIEEVTPAEKEDNKDTAK